MSKRTVNEVVNEIEGLIEELRKVSEEEQQDAFIVLCTGNNGKYKLTSGMYIMDKERYFETVGSIFISVLEMVDLNKDIKEIKLNKVYRK